MCPLVLELKKHREIECVVCLTGQHREMLEQVMEDTLPNDRDALLRAASEWVKNGMPQGGNEGGYQS